MPRNKDALIRYRVINRCLLHGKVATMEKLQQECELELDYLPAVLGFELDRLLEARYVAAGREIDQRDLDVADRREEDVLDFGVGLSARYRFERHDVARAPAFRLRFDPRLPRLIRQDGYGRKRGKTRQEQTGRVLHEVAQAAGLGERANLVDQALELLFIDTFGHTVTPPVMSRSPEGGKPMRAGYIPLTRVCVTAMITGVPVGAQVA